MNEETIINCSLCIYCTKIISHEQHEYVCSLMKYMPRQYNTIKADKKRWTLQMSDRISIPAQPGDFYVQNVRECEAFDNVMREGFPVTDLSLDAMTLNKMALENYIKYKGIEDNYILLPQPLRQQFIEQDNGVQFQRTLVNDRPVIKLKSKPSETFLISIFFFLMAFMYGGIIFHLVASYDPESFIHIFGIFVSTIGLLTFTILFIKSFKKPNK